MDGKQRRGEKRRKKAKYMRQIEVGRDHVDLLPRRFATFTTDKGIADKANRFSVEEGVVLGDRNEELGVHHVALLREA
jgi:hypothetical protein